MNFLKHILTSSTFLAFLLFCSCEEEVEIDTEYPEIDIAFDEAFPKQCSSINRGETFIFKARFTDNIQLGGYSVDIHHNFDHHTHSTEVNDCDMEAVKAPDNPFLFIQNYAIPEGQNEYVAEMEIEVPENVDSGDYHFMILLTDAEGWQTIKGLSIKIN
ncbi:hypothetical protein GCM10011506_09580 [Marivirga lumbricoides]|uniref:DUF4625 domain-containing protein n=1 Tax=Marivirga lumbricoides TaxID=1046115 RepID=A0ABQ1LLC9_9BACT|nr:hypothetical protein GCM10011506_09580 [Marivirga lumbricoides]